jgi:hypothetical protein
MGARVWFGFDPARIAGAVVALACSAVVAFTGAAGMRGGSAAVVADRAPVVAASASNTDDPCDNYVFSLDEIRSAEKQWPQQRDDMTTRAADWSANASFVQLTLSCDFFDNAGNAIENHGDINWNGVFYDPAGADASYWHSATGETYFVYEETALDVPNISFDQLADWLDDADAVGDDRIAAVIVTNNPGSKLEPDDHFSYVVTSVANDGTIIETIVDGRDGAMTQKTI